MSSLLILARCLMHIFYGYPEVMLVAEAKIHHNNSNNNDANFLFFYRISRSCSMTGVVLGACQSHWSRATCSSLWMASDIATPAECCTGISSHKTYSSITKVRKCTTCSSIINARKCSTFSLIIKVKVQHLLIDYKCRKVALAYQSQKSESAAFTNRLQRSESAALTHRS